MDKKKAQKNETWMVFRKSDLSSYGVEIGLWDALCEIGNLSRDTAGEMECEVRVSRPGKA